MKRFLIGLVICTGVANGMGDQPPPMSSPPDEGNKFSKLGALFKKRSQEFKNRLKSPRGHSESENVESEKVTFNKGDQCRLKRGCDLHEGKSYGESSGKDGATFYYPRLEKGDVVTFMSTCEKVWGKKAETLQKAIDNEEELEVHEFYAVLKKYINDIRATSDGLLAK